MSLIYWIGGSFAASIITIYFVGRRAADSQKIPYTFTCSEKRAAFERWHDHQIKQLGDAANTLFTLATAGLAYSLALLSETNRALFRANAPCIRFFTGAFAVSFLLGFFSIFNRLEDYRKTKRRHRFRDEHPIGSGQRNDAYTSTRNKLYLTTRRIGKWTWGLLYAQGFFFLIGSGAIIFFWIANYSARF